MIKGITRGVLASMPIRKVQAMGGSNGSTTYGISLDKGDLEVDQVLDRLEEGEEVRAFVSRQERGKYTVGLVEVLNEADEPEPEAGRLFS
ncbi:MAG TPA: hypothetical protein VKA37_04015 [Halobacteriales archaeon]|nr:hypothetical protein [Halobacteriales archaeon]